MSAAFTQLGLVCALGHDVHSVRRSLFAAEPSGVVTSTFFSAAQPLALGQASTHLPSLANDRIEFVTRNNALLAHALAQLTLVPSVIERHGPARVGVVIGTSTSGVGESEPAHRQFLKTQTMPAQWHFAQQELGTSARFVAARAGVTGPTAVISTACSSSARALATGARWLRDGVVDAVIAGGADMLCRFTIAGFMSLESVSVTRCNPMSLNRNGINIGEGAALFLMTRDEGEVRLAGWGETSDAHHMSAPDPSGQGAADAMRLALRRSQTRASDVEYVNLHGTATPQNDAMESRAVSEVCGLDVPVSSTKPLTGHTLGAAGAIEAALCWLAMTGDGALPPHWYDGVPDPSLPPLRLVSPGEVTSRSPPRVVLSNSFAFGGNNASLVFVRS